MVLIFILTLLESLGSKMVISLKIDNFTLLFCTTRGGACFELCKKSGVIDDGLPTFIPSRDNRLVNEKKIRQDVFSFYKK
jgi:hypothetical protein